MFGPSYFNQVGWIGDGEIIRVDELGLDELQAEWDRLVEASRLAHAAADRPAYAFDSVRDVVTDDGDPITFFGLVEQETGYRPLMEAEADEYESESAYQQAQELKRETLDALVENHPSIAVAVADVLNEFVFGDPDGDELSKSELAANLREAVEKAIDNLDVAELGAQLLSDISGQPING